MADHGAVVRGRADQLLRPHDCFSGAAGDRHRFESGAGKTGGAAVGILLVVRTYASADRVAVGPLQSALAVCGLLCPVVADVRNYGIRGKFGAADRVADATG